MNCFCHVVVPVFWIFSLLLFVYWFSSFWFQFLGSANCSISQAHWTLLFHQLLRFLGFLMDSLFTLAQFRSALCSGPVWFSFFFFVCGFLQTWTFKESGQSWHLSAFSRSSLLDLFLKSSKLHLSPNNFNNICPIYLLSPKYPR